MSLLDYIKNLLTNNKKNATIYTKQLIKNYGESTPFEVALFDGDNPLPDRDVIINVNNKDYTKCTDESGVARLNINLRPGEYVVLVTFEDTDYNTVTAHSKVTVKDNTRMEGIDIIKNASDKAVYQCAVYNSFNERVGGTVDITVNGVTYTRSIDNEGLAKLNINFNQPGKYTLTAVYRGSGIYNQSSVENVITVNNDPAPTPSPAPSRLHDYITTQGGGKLGQTNGVRCGPHSLMQCIYRLTGIELSEATLASICGTTSSGTSHSGLETAIAWFNRKYGYNIKMTWKNFSDVGWDGLQKAIDNGACFMHLLYRNQWGHYEVPQKIGSSLTILNSLGSYCSYPAYCGYIENRSRATQQSYVNGISQKSVCILTL